MKHPLTACGALLGCLVLYSCGSDGARADRGSGADSAFAGATDGGAESGAGGTKPQAGEGSAGAVQAGSAGQSGAHAGGGTSSGESGQANGGGAGEPSVGGAGGLRDEGGAGGESQCNLGEVQSAGTQQNLDLFGTVVYFSDGAELPAGRYRAKYVDGCMQYGSGQAWTIHAYAGGNPCCGWWFVGDTADQRIVNPPGTVGYTPANGAFSSFDECVAANQALPPLEFDFAGGKLGVWLEDVPYSDNLAGQDGRNPKWQLTQLSECAE